MSEATNGHNAQDYHRNRRSTLSNSAKIGSLDLLSSGQVLSYPTKLLSMCVNHLTDRSIKFGAQMAKISRLSSLSSFPRIWWSGVLCLHVVSRNCTLFLTNAQLTLSIMWRISWQAHVAIRLIERDQLGLFCSKNFVKTCPIPFFILLNWANKGAKTISQLLGQRCMARHPPDLSPIEYLWALVKQMLLQLPSAKNLEFLEN